MEIENCHILLIEDDEVDAENFKKLLSKSSDPAIVVIHEKTLNNGFARIERNGQIKLILLDLRLPESSGFDTFLRVKNHVPDIPIVVLTGSESVDLGIKAVKQGAQDYLSKREIDKIILPRCILYAIERHRLREELEQSLRREREIAATEKIRSDMYQKMFDQYKIDNQQAAAEKQLTSAQVSEEFLDHYMSLLMAYFRAQQLSRERPLQEVHNLAIILSSLNLQARHLVSLHLNAIDKIIALYKMGDMTSLTIIARLLLVDTMGSMLDIYNQRLMKNSDDSNPNMAINKQ